jgi:hypothetical protein
MLQPCHVRAVGHRHGRGGTGAAGRVEYGNLAEQFAVRVDRQQLHAPVLGFADQLDAAALQQIHAVVPVALAEDIVALVEYGLVQVGNQLIGLLRRHLLEQRRMQQLVVLFGERIRPDCPHDASWSRFRHAGTSTRSPCDIATTAHHPPPPPHPHRRPRDGIQPVASLSSVGSVIL